MKPNFASLDFSLLLSLESYEYLESILYLVDCCL